MLNAQFVNLQKQKSGAAVVEACRLMNEQMLSDNKNGKQWRYYNSGTKNSFNKAVNNGVRRTNCALFACWAFKIAGLLPENSGNFYGSFGDIKGNTAGISNCKNTCTFTHINGNKTVKTAISDGTLQPGDMVMYQNMGHTNIYAGNGKWYDAGHAYCKESGEGAKFITWYGSTKYSNSKISYIIRAKANLSTSTSTVASSVQRTIAKRIWIGDSRFEGMKSYCKGAIDEYISEIGKGYVWFNGTAISQLKSKLKSNSKNVAVIINLGVNDIENSSSSAAVAEAERVAKNYSKLVNQLITDYPDTYFSYMSVNPTSGSYSAMKTPIEAFNKTIKSNCNAQYIDTYSIIGSNFNSTDGLHYGKDTSEKIYNYACQQVSNSSGSTGSGSGGSAGAGVDVDAIRRFYEELFNFNIKNNVMANGTIVVKGKASYKVGQRIIIESENMEYYVESVTQSFNCYGNWTTTLGVTRGIEPENRFTPPWGCAEEMTPAMLNAVVQQTSGEDIDWTNLPEVSYTIGNGGSGSGGNGGTDGGGSSYFPSDGTGGNSSASEVEKSVYNYVTTTMGLSKAAACAIMGNIYYESTFRTTIVGDHGTSYGLCQWHNSRWTDLKNFCSQNNYDVSTVAGQMAFLQHELQTSFQSTWSNLKSNPNTAQGAYDGAYFWCTHFEQPQDMYNQGVIRGNKAKEYFAKY